MIAKAAKIRTEPIVKERETYGNYVVLAYRGQGLFDTKKLHYEHMFLVRCTVCGSLQHRRQKQLIDARKADQKWCNKCPKGTAKKIRQERAKEKKVEIDYLAKRSKVEILAVSKKWKN